MITEDYASFEIAELLKEKGFNEECRAFYVKSKESGIKLFPTERSHNYNDDVYPRTSAPTLQMVIKWLRVVHNINLSVVPHSYKDGKPFDYEFVYWHGEEYHTPYDEKHPTYHELFGKTWKKYEEACDAAIKYFLESLIQI